MQIFFCQEAKRKSKVIEANKNNLGKTESAVALYIPNPMETTKKTGANFNI